MCITVQHYYSTTANINFRVHENFLQLQNSTLSYTKHFTIFLMKIKKSKKHFILYSIKQDQN